MHIFDPWCNSPAGHWSRGPSRHRRWASTRMTQVKARVSLLSLTRVNCREAVDKFFLLHNLVINIIT